MSLDEVLSCTLGLGIPASRQAVARSRYNKWDVHRTSHRLGWPLCTLHSLCQMTGLLPHSELKLGPGLHSEWKLELQPVVGSAEQEVGALQPVVGSAETLQPAVAEEVVGAGLLGVGSALDPEACCTTIHQQETHTSGRQQAALLVAVQLPPQAESSPGHRGFSTTPPQS